MQFCDLTMLRSVRVDDGVVFPFRFDAGTETGFGVLQFVADVLNIVRGGVVLCRKVAQLLTKFGCLNSESLTGKHMGLLRLDRVLCGLCSHGDDNSRD